MEVLPLVDCNMSSLGGDFPNGSHHYLKPRETLQQESPKNQSFLTPFNQVSDAYFVH